MTDQDQSAERKLQIFCEKLPEAWVIHLGAGHLPSPLQPFFDEQLESPAVLLDFEHLDDSLSRASASIQKRQTEHGSVEITAYGDNIKQLAKWMGSAMASGYRPSGAD